MAPDSIAADPNPEKRRAAATSVLGAVALTSLKIVVGLATGSLGILAEAAHSGLDLVAALMTWFAVRLSGKPADSTHLYGHGKVENLSAFAETLLLVLTCIWIIWGAVTRLLSGAVEIEVTFWSFAVMFVSIAVDVSRSRVLRRAARKYNSQALEADALHFSTDIWSSSVVILGLLCVWLAGWLPNWSVLRFADAAAALLVAAIVLQLSARLGLRTVHALLDGAPQGFASRIVSTVEALPGISDCHNVRVRSAGPQVFVDVHVLMDGALSLSRAHDLTERVEEAVRLVIPHADVTVHAEPQPPPSL